MVGAAACLCTWDGLADLGAPEGLPFVLGHARSMPAIQGGKATNDTSDAHQSAVFSAGVCSRRPLALPPTCG